MLGFTTDQKSLREMLTFVGDVVGVSVVFVIVAVVALAIQQLVSLVRAYGGSGYVMYGLELGEYILFTVDLGVFVVLVLRRGVKFIKSIW
jgi:hypothetical protein